MFAHVLCLHLPRMKFHTMEVKLSEGQIVSYDGAGKLWFRDFCSFLDALDVPVGPCPHILYASFLSSLSSLVVSCQGSNSISIRLNANWSAQNVVEVGC